jgi:hypothetical protein
MNKVMKKNAFLILALIVVNISFCISTVIGQTNQDASISEHFLKFSLPIVHNQVKDNLVAPLRWDGIGSGLGFSWLTTGTKIIHEVCLIVNVSGLKNRYKYKGYALEASLGYSLSCKVSQGVLGGIIYLGPQLKWDSKINFFRDWDDSHIYWLNSYEAGPSLKWVKYYKEKHNVSLTMQIPFFAIISRPPEYQYIDQPPLIKPSYYFKSLNEDLRLVTLNNYFSLRLQVDYSYRIKNSNMIGGAWFFDYKACKFPRNSTLITNILMINYYKFFGKK